jgi:hypothetical protein
MNESQPPSFARRIISQSEAMRSVSICDKTHENEYVGIQTRALAPAIIEVRWYFKPPWTNRGLNLYGFRNDTGFSQETWNKTTNGTLIVDTPVGGLTHEHLRPGVEHFYTFIVSTVKRSFFGFGDAFESFIGGIRFKLYIPSGLDEAELLQRAIQVRGFEKQFENLDTDRTPPSRREVEVKAMLDELHTERDKREALRTFEIDERARIKALGLSPAAEEEELKALNKVVKYASFNYLKM